MTHIGTCINNTSGGGRCGPDPKLYFQNGTLRSLEEESLYPGTRQSEWDPEENTGILELEAGKGI